MQDQNGKPKQTETVREVFERQMQAAREANLQWPANLVAYRVELFETDEFGWQVSIHSVVEEKTAHTPEEVREWGNTIKVIAANEKDYNIAVFNWSQIDEYGDPKVIVYPRKVPKSIQDVTKLTNQRARERIQRHLHDVKVATQGVGDFDKKPDVEHFIEDLIRDEEEELTDN